MTNCNEVQNLKIVLLCILFTLLYACTGNVLHRDKDVVQKPVAKASATPLFGSSPLDVTFDAGDSFDSTGEPLQFLWRFDDGQSSNDMPPEHRFNTFGTYMVELTVTNSEGQEDTDWVVIIVN